MNKPLSKLKLPFHIIKLLFRYGPSYFILSIFSIFISPIIALLGVYFPKIFIDRLENNSPYIDILIPILYFGLFLFLLYAINRILNYFKDKYATRMMKKLQLEVANYALHLDFYQLENPENRTQISLAKDITSIVNIFHIFINIITNTITILGLSVLITSINILYLGIIFLVLIIKMICNILQFKFFQKIRLEDANNNKTGRYLDSCLYFNAGCAKEIRVNNLQPWFKNKVTNFRSNMLNIQFKGMRITFVFEIITKMIVSLQTCIILILLSKEYMDQNINIASFTMYFNALMLLSNALVGVVNEVLSYNRTSLNVKDFYSLSILKKSNQNKKQDFLQPLENKKVKLEFHNVSFKYPNTDNYILKNISITIENHEKIAIVGLNGAGKTTFIKLICKFYIPTSGYITWNGKNIWDIDNQVYYEQISAVFQDFNIFDFTIKDNVTMSQDKIDILPILKKVGLDKDISSFYDFENSYISKQFDPQGIELSGGQKQKLAMARAVFKKASLLILDEPTASLDLLSEKEIYEKFYELSKNKTVLFISHRLAISKHVNRILVFKDGRIIEDGTHNELIKNHSVYAKMYEKQVSYYQK